MCHAAWLQNYIINRNAATQIADLTQYDSGNAIISGVSSVVLSELIF